MADPSKYGLQVLCAGQHYQRCPAHFLSRKLN